MFWAELGLWHRLRIGLVVDLAGEMGQDALTYDGIG